MILGINASRARSGGARAHLIGLLAEADPARHGFREVHVWSYPELLDASPSKPWLLKHSPAELQGSIWRQLWWERVALSKDLQRVGCSVLLNVDAGTVCRFRPAVTMSRDMLSYEPGEIERFGFGKARLRLILLRYIQNQSLKAADGAIFLTRYAAKVIQQSCGRLRRVALIPHGVGQAFSTTNVKRVLPPDTNLPVQCLYVSNVAPYKHQWHVVRAIEILRKKGFDLQLVLTGGGNAGAASKAQQTLDSQIRASDPTGLFVRQLGFVPQHELPELLANAHVFVFASSCENMPNTLLEAMAIGLPIACSNRGPMPEVLEDGGVYFDPEDPSAIAGAIQRIITSADLRMQISARAKELSRQYSWARCTKDTFAFLAATPRGPKT